MTSIQKVQPFQFQHEEVTYSIRVERGENGEPWFNANDVCAATGHANARDALEKHVDEDDVAKRDTIDSLGRTQSVNFINESGVYSLMLLGKTERCKYFKRWVTNEVLPAIHRTGTYSRSPMTSPDATPSLHEDATDLLQVLHAQLAGVKLCVQKGIFSDREAKAFSKRLILASNNKAPEASPPTGQLALAATAPASREYYSPTKVGRMLVPGRVLSKQAVGRLVSKAFRDAEGAWLPEAVNEGKIRTFSPKDQPTQYEVAKDAFPELLAQIKS